MEMLIEQKLVDFEFWGGAKHNAFLLTYDELDQVESILQDLYDYVPCGEEINNLFWVEFDRICSWLGLTNDDIKYRIKGL